MGAPTGVGWVNPAMRRQYVLRTMVVGLIKYPVCTARIPGSLIKGQGWSDDR